MAPAKSLLAHKKVAARKTTRPLTLKSVYVFNEGKCKDTKLAQREHLYRLFRARASQNQGEKPFTCPFCALWVRRVENLLCHIEIKHGVDTAALAENLAAAESGQCLKPRRYSDPGAASAWSESSLSRMWSTASSSLSRFDCEILTVQQAIGDLRLGESGRFADGEPGVESGSEDSVVRADEDHTGETDMDTDEEEREAAADGLPAIMMEH